MTVFQFIKRTREVDFVLRSSYKESRFSEPSMKNGMSAGQTTHGCWKPCSWSGACQWFVRSDSKLGVRNVYIMFWNASFGRRSESGIGRTWSTTIALHRLWWLPRLQTCYINRNWITTVVVCVHVYQIKITTVPLQRLWALLNVEAGKLQTVIIN